MADTNYYLRMLPNKEQIELAHNALDEFLSFESSFENLKDLLNQYRPEIHIGAKTEGWQFAWNNHKEFFAPTYTSVVKWLRGMYNNGWLIETDDNKGFDSVDEFLDCIEPQLYQGKNFHNEYPTHKGVNKLELINDGLRFMKENFK